MRTQSELSQAQEMRHGISGAGRLCLGSVDVTPDMAVQEEAAAPAEWAPNFPEVWKITENHSVPQYAPVVCTCPAVACCFVSWQVDFNSQAATAAFTAKARPVRFVASPAGCAGCLLLRRCKVCNVQQLSRSNPLL